VKVSFIDAYEQKTISNSLFKHSRLIRYFPAWDLSTMIGFSLRRKAQVTAFDERIQVYKPAGDENLVCIYGAVHAADRMLELANAVKLSGATPIVTGPHITSGKDKRFDHFVSIIGPPTGIWEEVLDDFEAGKLKEKYHSKIIRSFITEEPLPEEDRATFTLGHGAYTLNKSGIKPDETNCWSLSVPDITDLRSEDELNALPNGSIAFIEGSQWLDRDQALPYLDKLRSKSISWIGEAEITIAEKDVKFLREIAGSNCRKLVININSLNSANAKFYRPGEQYSVDAYYALSRKLIDGGVDIIPKFMIGFEQDSAASFAQVLEYIARFDTQRPLIQMLTPMPGSPLYHTYEDKGLLTNTSWSDFDNTKMVFSHPLISPQEAEMGFVNSIRWLLRHYFRTSIIASNT